MVLRSAWSNYQSNFTSNPGRDAWMYLLLVGWCISYAFVACCGELLWGVECDMEPEDRKFPNPLYNSDPCQHVRFPELLYMTREETCHLRRIIAAVALGSIIGYERRSPDRPAGIRTMSVTALGSCTFTLASMFAFVSGPMAWDASRISASIPSGCGFLGAGLIWKGFVRSEHGGPDIHQVHGLTTAASIWMSAAVGVAAGGGMYFVACFSTLCIVLMLRFGPRNMDLPHDHYDEHDQDKDRVGLEKERSREPLNVSDSTVGPLPSETPGIIPGFGLTVEVVEALSEHVGPARPSSDIEQPLMQRMSARSQRRTESMASGETTSEYSRNVSGLETLGAEGARKRKTKRQQPSMMSYN